MKALVTGALGRIGRGVGAALRDQGYHVVGVDLTDPPAEGRILGVSCDELVKCDLCAAAGAGHDRERLLAALEGVQAVVHCAAWPGPSAMPPPGVSLSGSDVERPAIGLEDAHPAVLLRDNVASTAAVCDAAVHCGASRLVFSSSAFAMGYSHAALGPQSFTPRYLPLDEAHPPLPHESYGLSKHLGEQVLEASARTALSTSFVSLRFTNIIKREQWGSLPWKAPTKADPLTLMLWAYTHEDDVISAHVQAVLRSDAARPGKHEAYLIAAPDTRFTEPTIELLASNGIENVPLRYPLTRNASLISSKKAAERLGFRPRSWQAEPPRIPSAGSEASRRALLDKALLEYDLSGVVVSSGERLPSGASLRYIVYVIVCDI